MFLQTTSRQIQSPEGKGFPHPRVQSDSINGRPPPPDTPVWRISHTQPRSPGNPAIRPSSSPPNGSSGTVQKKRFTPTCGNRATRTPETYVNTTPEQHPTKRATVAVYSLAAFEHRSHEHTPVIDPRGRGKVTIRYELSWWCLPSPPTADLDDTPCHSNVRSTRAHPHHSGPRLWGDGTDSRTLSIEVSQV